MSDLKSFAAFLFFSGLLGACANQAQSDATAWYNGQNGVAPRADRIYVCHGFGCMFKTPIDFSKRDLHRLKSLLASGRKSPVAERAAIAKAVSWQETRIAPTVGSAGDLGGFDIQNAGKHGHMDCIDESSNTTSLLLIAQQHGYLHHHTVASPVARGFFLDGRYPHATATVREVESGKVFAIDSWTRANGEPPEVMALDLWMQQSSG